MVESFKATDSRTSAVLVHQLAPPSQGTSSTERVVFASQDFAYARNSVRSAQSSWRGSMEGLAQRPGQVQSNSSSDGGGIIDSIQNRNGYLWGCVPRSPAAGKTKWRKQLLADFVDEMFLLSRLRQAYGLVCGGVRKDMCFMKCLLVFI